MDTGSLECRLSCDGLDEEGSSHQHPPFPKARGAAVANGNVTPLGISSSTSIRKLLECPICTNFMYSPIHQLAGRVRLLWGNCILALKFEC